MKTIQNLVVLFVFLSQPAAGEEQYLQLVGAADLRTTVSDGCHSIDELADMASRRKIDVIIVADYDRRSLEYGFAPLKNILKYKVSAPSILSGGAKKYLRFFQRINEKYPELIAIPAVESDPFYYWSGGFFSGLTAHKRENHLMIIGMTESSQFEGLPTLNSNLSTNYFWKLFPGVIPFIIGIGLGILLFTARGYLKKIGIVVAIVSCILALNYHPFKSSLYDQYHGEQGVAPWQETIDYANNTGAMAFWHHIKSRNNSQKNSNITIDTMSHPESFIQTYGYTGFHAVNNKTIDITAPGKDWDMALKQYIEGKRKMPPWGIGGIDYRCEGEDGIRMLNAMTIFLVKEKTMKAVLSAMKNGKMYALRKPYGHRLSLDRFNVFDKKSEEIKTSGDTLFSEGSPTVSIKVSTTPEKKKNIKIDIIRSGKLIKTFKGLTPFKASYKDNYFRKGEKIYYRLVIHGASDNDYIISNPVFVQFPGNKVSMAEDSGKVDFVVMKLWGYLREKPNIDSKIAGFAETNEKLELVEDTGELYKGKPWYKIINSENKKAFLWSGLVKNIEKHEIQDISNVKSESKNQAKEPGKENLNKKYGVIKENESKGKGVSEKEYNEALSLFNFNNYSEAIKMFNKLLRQYPENNLTDDIHYWLAESYYALNLFTKAEKHYFIVVSNYPKSGKVKTALLKRGLTLNNLMDFDSSRKIFENVIEIFPHSDEAETAKKELKKLAKMEREVP